MASPNRAPPTTTGRTGPRAHLHPALHTAHPRNRPGSGTATPEGSATTTITALPPQTEGLVLRLRGAHDTETTQTTQTGNRRHIQWAEGTIDNEGLGRKKSKVCCIYHKTREVGESSSEDDSSSDESSDDESGDDGAARPVGGYKGGKRGRKGRGHKHGDHDDGDGDCDGHDHGHGAKGKKKPSPNAYERMPRYDVKPLERQPGR